MTEPDPKPFARRVTIRDVARRAGVSVGTVSHVLNGSKAVSDGTRRAVTCAADDLGYRPNTMARSLISRRAVPGRPARADLPRLISVGYISIDYMVMLGNAPQSGERVTSDGITKMLGGPAANVAAFAAAGDPPARIGVEMVTQLGRDDDSLWALEQLSERGVDPSGALQAPGTRLSRCIVMVEPGGRRTIINEPFQVRADTLVDHLARRPPGELPVVVHFDGFHADIAQSAEPSLRAAGHRISVHSAGLSSDWLTLDGLRALMGFCDVLMLNRESFEAMTARAPDLAADPGRAFGPPGGHPCCGMLVLTRGAEGATLLRPGAAPVNCPAPPVEVVDATGAGDAFTGLFLAGWLAGDMGEDALSRAVRGASASLATMGAQGALTGTRASAAAAAGV
ncbi:PfkB family carbohydrate kinase [Jannaschia sp. S6380]|uniref:carbohydrate kinase family protein n=1 Tax=Jannaschia sp. S6380 TaxID=2926408 RepID=UPI001FF2EA73|nr:PfkB family carbohydrate kinase [Jannaschia sp. S6380]MCK0168192.1 PfkB family carbohydrate kinase [Jannaschia sp. S6380]